MTASDAELNGDGPLSAGQRLLYLWQNALRNWRAGGGTASRAYCPERVTAEEINKRSPSRFLSSRLIREELPRRLPAGPINVLEIGCGSGSMTGVLSSLGYSGNYTGIDVDDRFRRDHPSGFSASFQQMDAHDYRPTAPVDLIFSFSALEHIHHDDELISRLSQSVKAGGLQFHIVPAPAALLTYLWHGYRQYTPSDLARRFGNDAEIYRLGGIGSLLVHFFTITLSEFLLRFRFREKLPGAYGRLVVAGFAVDRVLPIFPTALVVIQRR